MESTYAAVRWKLGPLFLSLTDVVTLGFALALALGTWGVLRFTDLGKAIRATTEDAPIAAAFGVNEKLLGYLVSGLAAAVAAVAGLCLALNHTLAPVQIYAWMGVVFAAVMMGGLGRPIGPLVAGIVIGVSEAITMAVTNPTWAPLVSFSLLIAILLFRPARFS
jgi:branched-chain amino acid transport system permease protein